LADAEQTLKSASDPIRAAVVKRSEYISALSAKRDAQMRLEALRRTAPAESAELAALAQAAMKFGAAAHKMEFDALEASPAVQSAREQLAGARSNLARLRAQFTLSLRQDPRWLAAKQAVDSANAETIAAERALAAG
jgi:hypothetical protein